VWIHTSKQRSRYFIGGVPADFTPPTTTTSKIGPVIDRIANMFTVVTGFRGGPSIRIYVHSTDFGADPMSEILGHRHPVVDFLQRHVFDDIHVRNTSAFFCPLVISTQKDLSVSQTRPVFSSPCAYGRDVQRTHLPTLNPVVVHTATLPKWCFSQVSDVPAFTCIHMCPCVYMWGN